MTGIEAPLVLGILTGLAALGALAAASGEKRPVRIPVSDHDRAGRPRPRGEQS